MPGDPLRAEWIAENFLEGAVRYSAVRGMYGFTGTYRGQRVSVQGSGMGMPSFSIYAHELFAEYGVQRVIRVGSCGALQPDLGLRDLVIATGASTDSQMNRLRFRGIDYAPTATFRLLRKAADLAEASGTRTVVGPILSSDSFYNPRHDVTDVLVSHGVLAVEMEAAALYTKAAEFGREALAILTVSDHIVTGEETTAEERQTTFADMVRIALDTIID
jgi:purine-nucleoside phosphorylase